MELNLQNKKSIYNETQLEIIVSIFYFAILEFVYKTIEVPIFEYVGYHYAFNIEHFVIGWGLYLFCILAFNSKKDSIYRTFLYTYIYLSLAPSIVLYQFEYTELWMIMYQIGTLILFSLIYKILKKLFPKKNGNQVKITKQLDNLLMLLIILFLIYTINIYGMPDFKNLSFSNISEVRKNSESSLSLTLVQTIMCKIIIPISILKSLDEKKNIKVAFLIIVQLYVYAVTGFKTYLFIPVLILGFNFLRGFKLKSIILYGLSGILVLTLLIYYITNNVMIVALLINRVIFLPAKIKWAYFDYFSLHEFVYFSQSTLGSIFDIKSIYDTPVVYLIGDMYFDSPEMWTNTGFMADAYANIGLWGSVFSAIVLSIELFVADKSVEKPLENIMTPLFVLFFISLNDGALITVSISGGMLFAILYMYIFDYNRGKKNEK